MQWCHATRRPYAPICWVGRLEAEEDGLGDWLPRSTPFRLDKDRRYQGAGQALRIAGLLALLGNQLGLPALLARMLGLGRPLRSTGGRLSSQ